MMRHVFTVIFIENGISELVSNKSLVYVSLCTNIFGKEMNLSFLYPSVSIIVKQTGLFNVGMVTSFAGGKL